MGSSVEALKFYLHCFDGEVLPLVCPDISRGEPVEWLLVKPTRKHSFLVGVAGFRETGWRQGSSLHGSLRLLLGHGCDVVDSNVSSSVGTFEVLSRVLIGSLLVAWEVGDLPDIQNYFLL